MGGSNLDVGVGGGPSLPLPDAFPASTIPTSGIPGSSGVSGSQAKGVPSSSSIQDKIDSLTDENSGAVTSLSQSITANLNTLQTSQPYMPAPFVGSTEGTLGGKGGPSDGSGQGNPWLSPNPIVHVQEEMYKLYNIQRQASLAMAKYENTTMALNVAYAQTAAELIIKAGDEEAKMAMLDAIAAGISAGASLLSLGASAGGMFHSMTTGREQISTAKDEMDASQKQLGEPTDPTDPTANPDPNTAFGQAEIAEKKFIQQQQKLDELNAARAKLDENAPTGPAAGTAPPTAAQRKQAQAAAQEHQAKVAKLDKEINNKKDEVAALGKERDHAKENLSQAKTAYENRRQNHSQMQQAQFTSFNNMTQMAGMLSTFLSQAATTGTKLASMQVITDKAIAQAQQQVVEALSQNIKQSGQSVAQAQQQISDAMTALMQALEKIVDETTKAMAIRRN